MISRAKRRERERVEYAGDWLAIEALGRDGLLVRSDGAFVRYLEVTPTNPLVLSDADCVDLSRSFGQVVSRIPARMSATFYVEATPLAVGELLEEVERDVDAHADRLDRQASGSNGDASGLAARAAALRALGDAEQISLAEHAEAQAAVEVRYYVLVPYMPDLPLRAGVADMLPGRHAASAPLTRDVGAHQAAAHKSLQLTEAIRHDLEALDLSVQRLDATEVARLLWASFAPHQSLATPNQRPRRDALEILGELDARRDATEARQAAEQLRDMIATNPPDDRDRRWVALDGGLEQTIYLSGVPEHTFYGWLLHAMQSTKPWTLSVHVHALDRLLERRKARERRKRLWGANRGRERERKMPDYEQLDQEHEFTDLVDELSKSPNAATYLMSIYARVREPGPDPNPTALADAVDQEIRDISQPVDVRLQRGEAMQRELWQSTVPIGLDVAAKTYKVVTRNVGDSIPLVGTSCGSPEGIPFAFSQSRTVERLNPFDPMHDNGTLIVNAKAGRGKTMTTILLLLRAIARGARGAVIDRGGHYEYLCSLIPGAVHSDVGAAEHTVNPWDVEDPANVPATKIEFLKALHAILVGAHNATHDSFGLEPLERNLLSLAIRGVYDTAARTGVTPCESLLQIELMERAKQASEEGTPDIAAVYRSLGERLHDYCGDGPAAALLDRPTTVPPDSPLVAFDLRHVQDDLLPAVMFVLAEYVERKVEQLREAYLSTGADPQPRGLFDGRFVFVVDEIWKLLARQATGAWANDLARRARHLGLFLIAITQQLSDLDTDLGRALLRNSTMKLFLGQAADELEYAREALRLGDEEIEIISHLKTSKRRFADAYLINGTRGRGRVTIRVAPAEYWIATSDPINDVPVRERALAESDGDPWAALALLCDPAWHEQA